MAASSELPGPSSPAGARRLLRLARYQLRKEAVGVVLRGAPWIFRDHLSSAAQVFDDGQWLRLVDGKNRVVGYGIYEARGAIAIRVLRRGEAPPDGAWAVRMVDEALARRAQLRASAERRSGSGSETGSGSGSGSASASASAPASATFTDAFRAMHGESDGLAAVVVDVFGDTI